MAGIINVNKLVELIGDKNHYTYIRVRNMLSGFEGKSGPEEIQQVREIIHKEMTSYCQLLSKLEKKAAKRSKIKP